MPRRAQGRRRVEDREDPHGSFAEPMGLRGGAPPWWLDNPAPIAPPSLEHGSLTYVIGNYNGLAPDGLMEIKNVNAAMLHELNVTGTPLNETLFRLPPNLQGSFAEVLDKTLEHNPHFKEVLFGNPNANAWTLTRLPNGAQFNFGALFSDPEWKVKPLLK